MKRVPQTAARGAGLSKQKILEVAVATADREGLGAVSMRRVAREQSVTPMALYWHFQDKDALLDAMVEQVIADAQFTDVAGGSWDERFRGVLTNLVALLHDHPWAGRPVIERLVPLPNHLAALEILLDCADHAGLRPYEGAVLVQQSVQAVVALVDHEPAPKSAGAEGSSQYAFLADLPPDAFPRIRAAADVLTTSPDLDDYYRLGIDMVVRGVAAIAATDRGPGR